MVESEKQIYILNYIIPNAEILYYEFCSPEIFLYYDCRIKNIKYIEVNFKMDNFNIFKNMNCQKNTIEVQQIYPS